MISLVLQLLFILFIFIFTLLIFLWLLKHLTTKKVDLNGKHVVVTGGSSGIGKSLACEAARRGANITIIARNQARLDQAKEEILQAAKDPAQQKIQALSIDMTGEYKLIEENLQSSEKESGPIFMLVNCAGSAICGILEDLSAQQIKSQLNLNTVGCILATKAVLKGMKERGEGYLVMVASQAAYIGIYGLSAYSASKYALRGFAEALNMEVKPYGIKVTVSYPPDTDTPGFEEEEKTKPKETKLISESSGLFQPQQVANKILDDSLAGRFSSNVGMDGFILEHLCSGMSPYESLFDLFVQECSMGILRCVAIGYNFYFQYIIRSCHLEKKKEVKQE